MIALSESQWQDVIHCLGSTAREDYTRAAEIRQSHPKLAETFEGQAGRFNRLAAEIEEGH